MREPAHGGSAKGMLGKKMMISDELKESSNMQKYLTKFFTHSKAPRKQTLKVTPSINVYSSQAHVKKNCPLSSHAMKAHDCLLSQKSL